MGIFRRSADRPGHPWAEYLKRIYAEEQLPTGELFEAQLGALPLATALQCPNGHVEFHIGEEVPVNCHTCGRPLRRIDVLASHATAECRTQLAIQAHDLFAKDRSRRGDTADAERSLTRILALKPNQEDALHDRAEARIALGNLKGGIEDCDSVIALNPSAADTYLTRGAAKARLGDYDAAIKDTNKALALGIKLPIAYYNRGMCLLFTGDREGSRSDLRRFLALAPDDDRAPAVRETLQALK